MNREPGQEQERNLYLQRFFGDFNQATTRLQDAFAGLEKKYELINRELDCKNLELQGALAEKERVNEYLRNILESLAAGVVVTDLEGKVTMMNRSAERLTGHSREGALGQGVCSLFKGQYPDWGDSLDPVFSAGDAGRKTKLRGRVLKVSGSVVTSKDGTEMGKVIVLRDITRIVKLEKTMKEGEKMRSMGEMAAHIAHEIRNPLGSIELFASLLMKDLQDEKCRERASHIIGAVRDMDHKISSLFHYARRRTPLMSNVNVHDVLSRVLSFSGHILEKGNVRLAVRYDGCDPVISGSDEMLRQVYLNLILNALQAMPEGGNLSVETGITGGTAHRDSHVTSRIADTGCGIPSGTMKKIFDPFYSTREQGMGLGLAIVKNIVDMHDGAIEVEENEGGGTVFTVTFPLIAADDEKKKNPDC